LIQYRNKAGSSRQLFEDSVALGRLVHRAGGTFIVNDRTDVALAAGAHGVHVGQADLPIEMARGILGSGKIVGYSTHNLEQVMQADRSTADYIAFGPIFPTASKERPGPVVGLDGLRQARKATRKPLVAIGGITLERTREVIDAGADSVAVIADLFGAPDLSARARAFLEILQES
jgi:thiamine-phosphate pyrophosphorylase